MTITTARHAAAAFHPFTDEPAYPRLEQFLIEVGRRKFVKPLFEALVKAPGGLERAKNIYAKARPGYHPITQTTIDAILK